MINIESFLGGIRKSYHWMCDKNKKIAICFVVYNGIEHVKIWRRWWAGYEDCLSVYVHFRVTDRSQVRTDSLDFWDFNRVTVPPLEPMSPISEELQLYQEALLEPQNAVFVFLSAFDVPLFSFPETYKTLMESSSMVDTFKPWKFLHRDLTKIAATIPKTWLRNGHLVSDYLFTVLSPKEIEQDVSLEAITYYQVPRGATHTKTFFVQDFKDLKPVLCRQRPPFIQRIDSNVGSLLPLNCTSSKRVCNLHK